MMLLLMMMTMVMVMVKVMVKVKMGETDAVERETGFVCLSRARWKEMLCQPTAAGEDGTSLPMA